jgi:hypothetical protein
MTMIVATSPLEAARRARYLRSFANCPDATPSQRRERWAEAETWQSMAVCGSFVDDRHREGGHG